MDPNYKKYYRENITYWIFYYVNSKVVAVLALLFTLRESRRTSDPALPRDRGKQLQLHPWRLDSEALRLLQR